MNQLAFEKVKKKKKILLPTPHFIVKNLISLLEPSTLGTQYRQYIF